MASEARRGCGYRKVGGLYVCGDARGVGCCQMPILMHVCPTCNAGVKQTRSWQWIDPRPWLTDCTRDPRACALGNRGAGLGEKVGLLWIGAEYYPRLEEFNAEAARLGISRRIKVIPRGFELGKSWVWLAHPKVRFDIETEKWTGGVFRIFLPTRFEMIVTDSQTMDSEFMEDLEKRGITAVVVPDDDPDHAAPAKRRPRGEPTLPLGAP